MSSEQNIRRMVIPIATRLQIQERTARNQLPMERLGMLIGEQHADTYLIRHVESDRKMAVSENSGRLVVDSFDHDHGWYNGYREALTQHTAMRQLGWWSHLGCQTPPESGLTPQDIARLLIQPELYVVPPYESERPDPVLLVTWVHEGKLQCRGLEVSRLNRTASELAIAW